MLGGRGGGSNMGDDRSGDSSNMGDNRSGGSSNVDAGASAPAPKNSPEPPMDDFDDDIPF
jgi:single-stranded DNA-binding protein